MGRFFRPARTGARSAVGSAVRVQTGLLVMILRTGAVGLGDPFVCIGTVMLLTPPADERPRSVMRVRLSD